MLPKLPDKLRSDESSAANYNEFHDLSFPVDRDISRLSVRPFGFQSGRVLMMHRSGARSITRWQYYGEPLECYRTAAERRLAIKCGRPVSLIKLSHPLVWRHLQTACPLRN